MNQQDLFDGLTDLSDDLIEEAQAFAPRRKPVWTRWAAAAAVLALIVGAAGIALGRFRPQPTGASEGGGGNDGGDSGFAYMHYVGPVLPLTAADDPQGVTVRRHVNYDFSPYYSRTEQYEHDGRTYAYEAWDTEAEVTDRYILMNETDTERTLTLSYPVETSFSDDVRRLPAIFVNEQPCETALSAAPYSGGFQGVFGADDPDGRSNLRPVQSWEEYVSLLSDGSYRQASLQPMPVLDMPVTVYRLDDYRVAPTDAVNPSLQIAFTVDPARTTVLTWGSNGGSFDDETGAQTRIVGGLGNTYREPEPMYVILCGDDIGSYTLQGYENMGANAGEEIEITAAVTRYETTMDEIVRMIVDDACTTDRFGADGGAIAQTVPRELLYGAVSDLLVRYGVFSDDPAERYSFGRLEDALEALVMQRILYLTFEVTIPAHGCTEVIASMRKDGSFDYYGEGKSTQGYDLAACLGSNLAFTELTASVSRTECIEIVENNFGFDLNAGVTDVTLDVEAGHYWMQILRKAE